MAFVPDSDLGARQVASDLPKVGFTLDEDSRIITSAIESVILRLSRGAKSHCEQSLKMQVLLLGEEGAWQRLELAASMRV